MKIDPILDKPMKQPNDAKAATIRDYLKALLLTLWEEGEGFSGKRPFGNSGWEDDLYEALMADAEDGCETSVLDDEIFRAIKRL